ncbi:MAG: DUF1343 domain-containing protein [Muribaculaceae bacterium]|nr:DUF1343 domain-containing protein [Muribaculaceae bacterium]
MKKTVLSIIFAALGATVAMAQTPAVKPGVEVLRDHNFDILKGKRVGLITNPSGVDNKLKSTVDILNEAPGVSLKALYGPEHGVRGDVHAGDHVEGSVDPATGVTVYSIYGKYRKPTPEMLDSIDVLVYDIQDNGCRSFTFISTMGLAMQACAEQGKEFVVLDRPNPAGANKVEGCIVEDGCYSFVSQFPIPYLYGLTPGELATYLNEEGLVPGGQKVNLTVVPMEGYKRDMTFSDTGMPWVLPSPHQPNAESALYYPATGILGELYYVSIGVGYTLPFKLVAADWIDAAELNRRLNALEIPGVMFRPIHIKPFYGTGQGENLQGVEIYITDPEAAPLTLIQFYILQELAEMYPDRRVMDREEAAKRFDMFDKVVGSKQIRQLFTPRHRVEDMKAYWDKDVEPFKAASSKYHLY